MVRKLWLCPKGHVSKRANTTPEGCWAMIGQSELYECLQPIRRLTRAEEVAFLLGGELAVRAMQVPE